MSRPAKKARTEERQEYRIPAEAQAYDRSLHLPQGKNLKNKKLASHLATVDKAHKASAVSAFEHDQLLLPQNNTGLLQAENDLDRTWRVTQSEIQEAVGQEASSRAINLDLQYGPYTCDFTANGRHLAIAGRKGHVATMDWKSGKLHSEIQLNETVRDISWLHDQSFFAVAQKRYVYIYDKSGAEVHQLRNHVDPTQLEFLRYHFLLASVGKTGYLKYQDTSTGSVVAEHRTGLGACDVMAQNPQTAILSLGHTNGTVTFWSPSSPQPHAKLLAHRGNLKSLAVDKQQGHYLATAGLDSKVKIWDMRMWEVVNEWTERKPAQSLDWSQKGLLSVGWGNHVSLYNNLFNTHRVGPYMTQLYPSKPVQDVQFCPFEDILGVGHSSGVSSMIVPGAGEPNFDSMEADPFETGRARQEREVNLLLDKIRPDQITWDREHIGKLARPVRTQTAGERQGKAPEVKKIGPNQDQVPWSKMSRVERLAASAPEGEVEVDEQEEEAMEQPKKKMLSKNRRVKGKNKERKRVNRSNVDIIDAKKVAAQERAKARKEQRQRAAEGNQAQADTTRAAGALGRFGSAKKR